MMMYEKDFKELINSLKKQEKLEHITSDSRLVHEGSLFFAIKGKLSDGNDFLPQITDKAFLAFTQNPDKVNEKVLLVWNARKALSIAASTLYDKKPDHIIAITGTNGKTSTANYFMQICAYKCYKSAAIGTIGVTSLDPEVAAYFDKPEYKSLTSPDPITFYKILDKLAEFGVTHLAFEASSHGLDQERAYATKLKGAIFTSFSRDHLDYHSTMDEYLQAKLKILDLLEEDGLFVMPKNIDRYQDIKRAVSFKDIALLEILEEETFKILESSIKHQKIRVSKDSCIDFIFDTDIIGKYQIYNLLCAAFMSLNYGIDYEDLAEILPKIRSVNGRLERLKSLDTNIFIDYAHTPDALSNSLAELKKLKINSSKLLVVFGCGGNRDQGKRSEMGEVASKIADYVIITDDNPRNEDPEQIRQEIISGIKSDNFCEIGEREMAIKQALSMLNKDDILLIAGKGHEDYQIIGNNKIKFDDKEIASIYSQLS